MAMRSIASIRGTAITGRMMFSAATKASLQNRWQSGGAPDVARPKRAVRLSLSFVRSLPMPTTAPWATTGQQTLAPVAAVRAPFS
jgi:hypothetical protein